MDEISTSTNTQGSPAQITELMKQIAELNANLKRDIKSRESWKIALRNGLIGAIGGLVGTSVLVALAVQFLKPLNQIRGLGPALERIANQQRPTQKH